MASSVGIGSKLVEVPYARLQFEAGNKVVMPNATRDELNNMASFSYNALEHSGTTNASDSSTAGGETTNATDDRFRNGQVPPVGGTTPGHTKNP